MSSGKVRLVVALALSLGWAPAQAAPVLNVPTAPKETLSNEVVVGDIVRVARLKEIVDILNTGLISQAKAELGTYLRENPRDPRALELAGMIFMQEGNYPLAEETLTKAILNDGRRASAIAKLGAVLLLQNKSRGAEIALNKALEVDRNEPLALRYIAYLEQVRGRPLSVIYYLERLMQTGWVRTDQVTEAHIALAQAYALSGQEEGVRNLLTPLLLEREVPDPGEQGLLLLTEAELDLGDTQGAKKAVALLKTRVGEQDYRYRVAAASVRRLGKDYAGAVRELNELLKAAPDRATDIHYQIALARKEEKNWTETARELELAAASADERQIVPVARELSAALASNGQAARALQLLKGYQQKFPDAPMLPYLAAEIRTNQGDNAGAKAILTELTKRHDRFNSARYLLGLVQWKLGEIEPARATLREVVTVNPKDIKSWMTLMGMYDSPSAVSTTSQMYKVLEEGLKANPNHPDLLYEKATILYSSGDVPGAQNVYRLILRQVPDHVPAMTNLALSILTTAEHPDPARPFVEGARARAPNDPAVLDVYGYFLLRKGDRGDAVRILEPVAKARPNDALVQYHLGAAYLQTGKPAEGRAKVQEALRLGLPKPERQKAQTLLAGNAAPR